MTLYENLDVWLTDILNERIEPDVVAMCFNIYDNGNCHWSLEVVGTTMFDMNDPDWACEEVEDFGTREMPFTWIEQNNWEGILEHVSKSIVQIINSEKYSFLKRQLEGIATGFVDGDLVILYKKENDKS